MDNTNENTNNDRRFNHLLKANEVAKILKISEINVYALMQRGEIPTVRIGKSRRVQLEDLILYIKNNTYQETQ
jgi:excisionase family DNA binding protein